MKTRTKTVIRLAREILVPGVLLATATTPAFGVIHGSFALNGDGTVTYAYEIDNQAGPFDISAWSVDFGFALPDWNRFDAPLGDVAVPNPDWVASPGTPITGLSTQDFLSLGSSSDVLVNGNLTGFSFTSAFLPGPVTYREFSATGESAIGETIGPAVGPVAMADSGSGVIEAMAFVSLAAVGASRKLNRRAATT